MKSLRFALLVGLFLTVSAIGQVVAREPVSLRIVGWNLQSDFTPSQHESDPDFIQQQMADKSGVHLWGLCEVLGDSALAKFEEGAEDGENTDFRRILGTTGNRDRLAILYDTGRLDLLGTEELGMIQLSSGLRAPLVAHFRGKRTGQEFLFMVNHLKRGGAQNPVRIEQAKLLNEWVRTQTLPVVACGDYNFDYDVELGDHSAQNRDRGFDEMTKDGKFRWLRPELFVKTNSDDEYNTILDFIFVANAPFGWFAKSTILEREGDSPATENEFDDDAEQSDHRPVDVVLTLGGNGLEPPPSGGAAPTPAGTREAILRDLEALQQQLQALRQRVQQLAD